MSRKQRKQNPPKQTNVVNINDQSHQYWRREKVLQPINEVQSRYMEAIRRNPYIFATGYAGTSKTYIPSRMFASWLDNGDIQRIIIARPATSMSESLGFFKGDQIEKMRNWIAPVLEALEAELPPRTIDHYLEHGKILAVPLETIKGRSFKNCGIIIDESEDLTAHEVVTIITRLGTNSTMVFAGDINQVDIASSGVGEFLDKVEHNERLRRLITHIDFCDHDDIVRSEAVKEAIIGMEEIGF